MKAGLVSLIIPVYNAEPWITRCLTSILHNTYTNFEIICVNDGSTDGSLERIEALQASDDRIRLVTQANRGVSAARNAGLQQVRGEYVAFVDADDWVHPAYLAALVTCLEQYDADIAVCDYKNTGEFDPHEMNTTFDPVEKVRLCSPRDAMMHFQTKAYVCAKLFRAKDLSGLRFCEELSCGEDTAFCLTAISGCSKVVFFDQKLYFYFYRPDSASRTAEDAQQKALCYYCLGELDRGTVRHQDVFLAEALKIILAYRYGKRFTPQYAAAKKECAAVYKRALSHRGCLAAREWALYLVLLAFPGLYRAFRISKDKSLLIWEAEKKKQYRPQSKH